MTSARVSLACIAAALACACDHGSDVEDGGAADAAIDAGVTVTPPDIPWIDRGVPAIGIAPCPSSWRAVMHTDVTTCEPYAETGPATCPRGEAHFPGTPGCSPLGDPCPIGDYATTLPSGGVVYVRAGAAPGGDGSVAAPFATLAEVGWATLAMGATVALAKGTYDGTLPLGAGVNVVGACAAETIVRGAVGPSAVITAAGAGSRIVRNLTLIDAPQAGVHAERSGELLLDGVGIERALEFGIFVEGAGSIVELEGVLVAETRPAGGAFGRGAEVSSGARLEGNRVVLRENHDVGIFAAGVGTAVTLTDALVHATHARETDRTNGRGINLQMGASLSLSRTLVESNREMGIYLGSAATASLVEVVVRGTEAQESDGTAGRGVNLRDGAHLEASRVLLDRNRDVALFLHGEGTSAVLDDTVVRSTAARSSDGTSGRGIEVQGGGHLESNRILIATNRDVGVAASDDGTSVLLTDALVRDTLPRESDASNGRGLNVQGGAHLDASRAIVEQNRGVGVYASGRSVVTLTDVIVRDTAPQESTGTGGYGASAENGARLDADRLLIEGTFEIGLLAYRADATIVARDVSVVRVARSLCECPERVFGHGVAAVAGGVTLDRFEVREAASCGLLVVSFPEVPGTSSLDVSSGVVADSPIGACVQVDGYDVSRLMDGVFYRDNGVNLDSTTLPVPEPIDPAGP